MYFTAKHRFAPISPTKVRPVIDLIKGKSANEALQILKFVHKRGKVIVDKVLRSAVANAGLDANPDELYVTDARADVGPSLRRARPGSRWRLDWRTRRSSHVTIVLSDGRGER